MSGWLVGLIVCSVVLIGLGARVLAEQLGRYPAEFRGPGPLIQVRRSKPSTMHNPELRRLTTLISYAVIDDPSSKIELQRVFEQLDAPLSPLVASEGDRRGKLQRTHKISEAIEALEQRYRL
jgi:hypothetical protein